MSDLQSDVINEFESELQKAIHAAYTVAGIAVKIKRVEVHKTNETVNGLTISKENESCGSGISPTIYPKDYERDVAAGMSIYEIAEKIKSQVEHAYEQAPKIPILTSEEASKHIKLVLINKEQNSEVIKNCPHYDVGDTDITAIPRWFLDTSPGADTASFIVTNDVAKNLNMTAKEIIDVGFKNIQSDGYKVRSMEEVISEMMDPEFSGMMPQRDDVPQMIVISNESGIYGAAGIINEKAMKQVANKLGTDEFYLIPSSVHETIAIRSDINSPTDIKAMICEVNSTQLSKQDFLSNELVKYRQGKLELAIRPKIDRPIVAVAEHAIKHKMKM